DVGGVDEVDPCVVGPADQRTGPRSVDAADSPSLAKGHRPEAKLAYQDARPTEQVVTHVTASVSSGWLGVKARSSVSRARHRQVASWSYRVLECQSIPWPLPPAKPAHLVVPDRVTNQRLVT